MTAVLLKLLKRWDKWNAGEVAGFSPEVAEMLVKQKAATEHFNGTPEENLRATVEAAAKEQSKAESPVVQAPAPAPTPAPAPKAPAPTGESTGPQSVLRPAEPAKG